MTTAGEGLRHPARRGRAARVRARRRRDRLRLLAGSPRFIDPAARTRDRVALPAVRDAGRRVRGSAAWTTYGVAGVVKLGAMQLHGRRTGRDYARSSHPDDQGGRRRRRHSTAESACAGSASTRDGAARRARSDPARRHGPTIDWTHRRRGVARLRPIILSGGLTAENVAERSPRSARTQSTCRRASSRRRASRTPTSCAALLRRRRTCVATTTADA